MADIKWIGCASRNFRPGRPPHLEIEAVVIHIIVGSQGSADATFLDNNLSDPRSAHYSVGRDGSVHQYVREQDTAFHAGRVVAPTWTRIKKLASGDFANPNFYTIGIEHEGQPDDDWTDAMYAASAELLRAISGRYGALKTLDRSNVVMHREIRATKTCPGTKVDMMRLIAKASRPSVIPPSSPDLVTTVAAVNLRVGSPSTSSPVDRVLPQDTLINVLRCVRGQPVMDRNNRPNDKWYETIDGTFLWAGATDKPDSTC